MYDGLEWQQGHALAFPVYYDNVSNAVPPPNPNADHFHAAGPYAGFYDFLNANYYVLPSDDLYAASLLSCFNLS